MLSNTIDVVSFGCGNAVDGFALSSILPRSCSLRYYGVDRVDWQHKLPLHNNDKFSFTKMDIVDYLDKQDTLSADVYIFPKSISEFSDDYMREICAKLRNKFVVKQEVHFMFSLRNASNPKDAQNDLYKVKMLYDTM